MRHSRHLHKHHHLWQSLVKNPCHQCTRLLVCVDSCVLVLLVLLQWMERKDTCPICESKMTFPGQG